MGKKMSILIKNNSANMLEWSDIVSLVNSILIILIGSLLIYALVSIGEMRSVIGRMVKELNIINRQKDLVDNSQTAAIRHIGKN